MTAFYKQIEDGYITGIGENGSDSVAEITEAEYNELLTTIHNKPRAEKGYSYMLRAYNLVWELVEVQTEPITEDEALTRYANKLTGSSAETLEEATETMIKTFMGVN